MPIQIRRISLLLRQSHSVKEGRRVLRCFEEWQALQRRLPTPHPSAKRLLLIRLDDIGDYLLFRNQLAVYKKSPRWKDHFIALLANDSWKELFTMLDAGSVDEVIWVNKSHYLASAPYRMQIWEQLRDQGFETVIATSRTRPLLLDDLCTLAAAPLHSIGALNSHVHARWNQVSDGCYTQLFTSTDVLMHEFPFNARFADWACGIRCAAGQLRVEHPFRSPLAEPYIVCFIGANTRSKRWPVKRWIQFIRRYRQHFAGRFIIAGGSPAEVDMARTIQERTHAHSIAGKATLAEFLDWVAGAQAVVTNDTMAAHMSACLSRPTVIVANGVNYMRFTEYCNIAMPTVSTVYPRVFSRRRRRVGDGPYSYPEALTADIASIGADIVIEELERVIAIGQSRQSAGEATDVHHDATAHLPAEYGGRQARHII